MQGYIAHSEIEKSACGKMLWFTIWSVFFANVLTGSVTSQLQMLLDPKAIPALLAVVVPAQVHLFMDNMSLGVSYFFFFKKNSL